MAGRKEGSLHPPSKAPNARVSEQKSPATRVFSPSVGPMRSQSPERGGDVL